jgi:tetratricopeptide (TPR) repeat protein
VATSFGAADTAARQYAVALAITPENRQLAGRALILAIAAGDRDLALRAARTVAASGPIGADVRFLLLSEAVRASEWKEANRQLNIIEDDKVFGQLAPILRAWIAVDTKRGDPLKLIGQADSAAALASYTAEHRALLLLALGKVDEGVNALSSLSVGAGGRAQRLKIAAAARLQQLGETEKAKLLLGDPAPPFEAARKLIEAGQPIPAPIDDAASGIGEFFARVAADVAAQSSPQIALNYARMATFLAPENSETWLVTSELLAASKMPAEALKALDQIERSDPFGATALDTRLRLLAQTGDREAAIQRAEAEANAPGAGSAEWARLGSVYNEAERFDKAAEAFGRAIASIDDGRSPQPKWVLHLLRGGALEQSGQWPEGKKDLEQAYALAPDEALVLNYLGYAQLSRRENIVEAESLIRKASSLAPDNAAITDSLGWALFLTGKTDEAVTVLERAATSDAEDPTIHEHLGDAYFTVGRRREARFAWSAALLNAEGKDSDRIKAKLEQGLTPQLASP